MPAPSELRSTVEDGFDAPLAGETSGSSDSDAAPAGRAGRCWARAALGAAGAAAACGLLLLGASHWSQRHSGAGSQVVGLGVMDALEEMLDSTGDVIEHGLDSADDLKKLNKKMKDVSEQLVGEKEGSIQNSLADRIHAGGPLIDALKNGSFKEWAKDPANHEMLRAMMKHHNQLADGNYCEDDEEEHASLCYKKCEDIDEDHPVRCTAFSCAKDSPCSPFNQRFIWKICAGFDIAGDSSNNACPHTRGACYADEEVHLNRCYKKCALLTEGKYPWRSAAESCCKYKGATACMEAGPTASKTSEAFSVGGGEFESDGIDASKPHPPLLSQAEDPSAEPEADQGPKDEAGESGKGADESEGEGADESEEKDADDDDDESEEKEGEE